MLKLVENGRHGRDMLELLEELVEEIRAGKIEGIIVGKLIHKEHVEEFDDSDHQLAVGWCAEIEYRSARFHYMLEDMRSACFDGEFMSGSD